LFIIFKRFHMCTSLCVSSVMIMCTCEENMYCPKTKYKYWKCDTIIPVSNSFVKKKCGSRSCRGDRSPSLLLAEGLAVGALVLGGVHLMGAHQDPVQRAVVLVLAMVSALLNSAFDAFVGMTIHRKASFDFGFGASMSKSGKSIQEKASNVAFGKILWYDNCASSIRRAGS